MSVCESSLFERNIGLCQSTTAWLGKRFFYVLRGKGTLVRDGEHGTVEVGDVISVPAGTGVVRAFLADREEDLEYLAFGERNDAIAFPNSGKILMLPPMICLGAGMGFLTPAVVAAAMGSVSDSRSGFASGANDTARQTFGAIGVARFGALAGSLDTISSFLSGLRTASLSSAGLWVMGDRA